MSVSPYTVVVFAWFIYPIGEVFFVINIAILYGFFA